MDGLEVPPYFICPISLQLMKDPVTVSTGVSYDRESIERWLSGYHHNNCPVTNQPLPDRLITPNSTLLRLIHSWAAASPLPPPISPQPAADLSHIRSQLVGPDPNLHLQALQTIKKLIQADPETNDCMELHGIALLVASLIASPNHPAVVEAIAVLELMKPSPQTLNRIANAETVRSLASLLQRGSYRARIHSTHLLRSIYKVADVNAKATPPPELFDGVVEMLKDQNSDKSTTMAVLSILMEVVPHGSNLVKAVEAGAVPVMVELLMEDGEDRRRCEGMLSVLGVVCQRAEGRLALLAHPAGVAAVVARVLRVSSVATERAVKILMLLCRACGGGGVGGVAREMMEVGGVAKLCMVVQVEGSRKAKERAKEILGMHMKSWSLSPCFSSFCLP